MPSPQGCGPKLRNADLSRSCAALPLSATDCSRDRLSPPVKGTNLPVLTLLVTKVPVCTRKVLVKLQRRL